MQYSIFIGKNKCEADGLVNYKAAKTFSGVTWHIC